MGCELSILALVGREPLRLDADAVRPFALRAQLECTGPFFSSTGYAPDPLQGRTAELAPGLRRANHTIPCGLLAPVVHTQV